MPRELTQPPGQQWAVLALIPPQCEGSGGFLVQRGSPEGQMTAPQAHSARGLPKQPPLLPTVLRRQQLAVSSCLCAE